MSKGRRFGFHSGNVRARNIQCGSATMTSGSNSISFDPVFTDVPKVVATCTTSTLACQISTKSVSAATIKCGSGTDSVDWIAYDEY